MNKNTHGQIMNLLEDTNDAFTSTGGGGNIDYAGFAAMALAEFKDLLNQPNLTGKQLRRLIRKGEQKRRTKDPEGNWASFMANYVAQNANQNNEESAR